MREVNTQEHEILLRFAKPLVNYVRDERHLRNEKLTGILVSREWMDAAKRILDQEDDPDGVFMLYGVPITVAKNISGFEFGVSVLERV